MHLISQPAIVDIRSNQINTVEPIDVLEGLKGSRKFISSLLLWDTRGLQLFTKITRTHGYYLAGAESRILEAKATEIADGIEGGTRIIELGAGDLNKTGYILRALEHQRKDVEYVALDVDLSELQSSLARITANNKFHHVKCSGLLGTYEDCADWLNDHGPPFGDNTVFLWLGGSCCNLTPVDMLGLMQGLVRGDRKMIIGIDGSDDVDKLKGAYATPCGLSAQFILNGLVNTNRMLDSDQFNPRDWEFKGRYNSVARSFESYVVAKRASEIAIEGQRVTFAKGDHVLMIESRKLNSEELLAMCEPIGITESNVWEDANSGYALCVLAAKTRTCY